MRALLLMGVLMLLSACGKPVGSPCSIQGSGFTASHDCATKCLSRWGVNCPDGSKVTPGVCAGRSNCTPGSCGNGEVCYHFDDPFEERSYCIPDNVCGELADVGARALWEQDSMQAAAVMRATYEARRQKRSGAVTAPAPDLAPKPTTTEP